MSCAELGGFSFDFLGRAVAGGVRPGPGFSRALAFSNSNNRSSQFGSGRLDSNDVFNFNLMSGWDQCRIGEVLLREASGDPLCNIACYGREAGAGLYRLFDRETDDGIASSVLDYVQEQEKYIVPHSVDSGTHF